MVSLKNQDNKGFTSNLLEAQLRMLPRRPLMEFLRNHEEYDCLYSQVMGREGYFNAPDWASRVCVEKREKCPYGLDVDAVILDASDTCYSDPWVMEILLFKGFRRYGSRFFLPRCPSCSFCASVFFDVLDDEITPEQDRASEKNRDVVITDGPVEVTREKLALMEEHLAYFYLEQPGYKSRFREAVFQLRKSVNTLEVCYRLQGGRLLGYAILDKCKYGSSMMCFIHDPRDSDRLLEIFNLRVLKMYSDSPCVLYMTSHILRETIRRHHGYLYTCCKLNGSKWRRMGPKIGG
jgi:arginyl-tRNA--protein-N-Asp/Glu arginylyltransferase